MQLQVNTRCCCFATSCHTSQISLARSHTSPKRWCSRARLTVGKWSMPTNCSTLRSNSKAFQILLPYAISWAIFCSHMWCSDNSGLSPQWYLSPFSKHMHTKKKRLVFYRNLHSASQWLRWNTVTALLRASGRPRIIKIEWNLSRGLVHAAMRNLWQWKSFKMLSLRAVALVRSLYGNAPITQAMAGL